MKTLFTFIALLCITSLANSTPTLPSILDEQALDKSINPCDNFYQFACGGWIKSVVLPSDKNAVFRQWSDLDDINDLLLNKILSNFSNGEATSSEEQKLGDYYQSCMASTQLDSGDVLTKELIGIHNISSSKDLALAVARLHLQGANVFFSYSVGTDTNNSAMSAGFLDQGGLGLPDRESYFTDSSNPSDPKWQETLQKYQLHIQNMLRLSGYPLALSQSMAASIVELETKLAAHALTQEQRRDPQAIDNPMSLNQIKALTPNFDWDAYLLALGTPNASDFIVAEPEFYKNLNLLLADTKNLQLVKAYFTWQLANSVAAVVGGRMGEEHFAFFGQYMRGKKTMEERWKTCTHLTGDAMPDALGQAFVKVTSGEAYRNATNIMIDEVKSTLHTELMGLDWLDESTRAAAIAKLSKLNRKVGYTSVWQSYEALAISPKSILENTFATMIFKNHISYARIGKPVDRNLFDMPPWVVNAYYDPGLNEFVFPLAQLLPPSLDLTASIGANWGALGATLGHEMSHGYDDEGHQFDGDGNLKNWWSESVQKEFEKKTQCYIDQANKFEALPGLFVNGQVTLGENLADQGGTKFAYLTYKRLANARGTKANDFAGYNEEQQFFLSYAQSWCGKMTDESLRLQVQSDVHPPTEFRVNMVLKNMQPFRQAFACAEGTNMAPANTCSLW